MGDRNPFSTPSSHFAPLPDTDAEESRVPGSPSPLMADQPFTTQQHQSRAAIRSISSASFISSPLNPASPHHVFTRSFSRPASRTSTHLSRLASYDDPAGALLHSHAAGIGPRGSMILYRLADDRDRPSDQDSLLAPPKIHHQRDSLISNSGDSIVSFSSDSKYPSGPRGLVAYPYDPTQDELDAPNDEDFLHDPEKKGGFRGDAGAFPWRGILNVGVLVFLLLCLLSLFIFYPVLSFYRSKNREALITGNIRVNGTGQTPVLFNMPQLIDPDTPQVAQSRTGFDGNEYTLVFSDEFTKPGRTFYPGDDPFWEAVDLWYGATGDLEWYDPQQVTTRNGALVITMDSIDTLQPGLTPNSTAPFTPPDNHNLNYRSGMLQSWNKFCFTRGYIEVAAVFPGPDQNTQGYWPGAWTMGNLARPGYAATTNGMWPYTYDSCDVGTFPNQTDPGGLGPPAALHSDASRDKYNFDLSWLPGQRLSSCSCPNSDHPGPIVNGKYVGRGAPELDILEAEKDKDNPQGQVVSQSAQFAPFSADYIYLNSTADQFAVYSPNTRPNSYHGSAVQQAVSGLTVVPSDMFQGSGQNFTVFGFEYWSDPNDPTSGYVEWVSDGTPSYRMGAGAVGPDPLAQGGSGVSQRMIPLEPMSIILNLGISPNWQTIDTTTMMFPSEYLIDYVRVYQRKDQINIGCDPEGFPTAQYINDHLQAYMDVNMTQWQWATPVNQLYNNGQC